MPESYTEDFEVLSSQGSDDELAISDGDINLSDVETYSSLNSQSTDFGLGAADFDNGSTLVEINSRDIPNVMSLSASLALNSLMPLDHDLHLDADKLSDHTPPASPVADLVNNSCDRAASSTVTLRTSVSPPVIPRLLLLLDGGVEKPAQSTEFGDSSPKITAETMDSSRFTPVSAYDTLNQWFTGSKGSKSLATNDSASSQSTDSTSLKSPITSASTTSASTTSASTLSSTLPSTGTSTGTSASIDSNSIDRVPTNQIFTEQTPVLNLVLSGDCTEETRDYVTQLYSWIPGIALSWYDPEQDATLVLPTKNGDNEALYESSAVKSTTRIRFLDARQLGSSAEEVSKRTKELAGSYDFMVVLGPFDLPMESLCLPAKQAALGSGDSWRSSLVFTNSPAAALEFRTLLHNVGVDNNMPLQSEYSSLKTPEQRALSLVKRACVLASQAVLYAWLATLVCYVAFKCYEIFELAGFVVPDNIIVSNFTESVSSVELPKELQVVNMDRDVGRVLVPLGIDIQRIVLEMVQQFRMQLHNAQAMLAKVVNYVSDALGRPNLKNLPLKTLRSTAKTLPTILSQSRRAEMVDPALTAAME